MKNKLVANLIVFLLVVLALSSCSQEAPASSGEENIEETMPVENQEETSTQEETSPKEEAAPMEKEDQLAEVRVIVETLNVRSGSTTDSEVIGQFKKDQVVKPLSVNVLDEGNYWYQVTIDGNNGWIAGWYTLNNKDYENKVFKSHLLPAFEGKLPPVKGTLKMTYDEVVSLYGSDLEAMNFLGGKSLYNEQIAFQFGEEGMAFINIRPDETVYGITPGSTLKEVKSTLGAPDQEYTIDDPEEYGIFIDGATVIVYLTGSHRVNFVFNEGVELTSVQLATHNLASGSTESTP